jgi:hypothetical protein
MSKLAVIVTHGANGVIFVQADVDGVRVKKEYSDGWTIKRAIGDFVAIADSIINL